MKKIETLGIFDSGLGGYTVYQDLKHELPELSMVLFADQKNAPYGNYDHQTIIKLAKNAMNWFLDEGITDVLLACNTVTSVALEILKDTFPQMRIWGIIDLTLEQLPNDVKNIAVVATTATVSTLAYTQGFNERFKGNVEERAMKDLAIAIETLASEDIINDMIEETMSTLDNPSHIILGCTHYPLVKSQFEKVSNATLVDSILPIRNFIKNNYKKTDGNKRIVTTKDAKVFQQQINTLYNENEEVKKVCLK
ncbi:MAG TPA: aspartate/glutamate racemase family protein [Erysipelothrix sp.]|nr:aspartate/glutamate racemase family protein [Erysipelothrix sp.]